MENNSISFSSMAAALLPAEDSLNQMLCAPPLRAHIEQNDPSGESENAFRWHLPAPVIKIHLDVQLRATVLAKLLSATHIAHVLLEKRTGDPSLTAFYRNVARAKGFNSSVSTNIYGHGRIKKSNSWWIDNGES